MSGPAPTPADDSADLTNSEQEALALVQSLGDQARQLAEVQSMQFFSVGKTLGVLGDDWPATYPQLPAPRRALLAYYAQCVQGVFAPAEATAGEGGMSGLIEKAAATLAANAIARADAAAAAAHERAEQLADLSAVQAQEAAEMQHELERYREAYSAGDGREIAETGVPAAIAGASPLLRPDGKPAVERIDPMSMLQTGSTPMQDAPAEKGGDS